VNLAPDVNNTRHNKQYLPALILATILLLTTAFLLTHHPEQETPPKSIQYTYQLVNVYPHDPNAFTEGLAYEDGALYESTGLYGQSTLRHTELKTGKMTQQYTLPNNLFGEGLTIYKNTLIQLTWLQHTALVYDKNTLNPLKEFNYPTEGWGLTSNGTHLIMSDGTANLYYLNPETFQPVKTLQVHDENPITQLNELEYIKGEIYANIWHDRRIARIDPNTGQLKGWIDLSHIVDYNTLDPENVLNGIAYNPEDNTIYVTGKRWPQLFEIRLIPLQPT
jgi:glutamine cyclotransferase